MPQMKANLEDTNFMSGMEQLLGMNADAVEELLDRLDANSLIKLADAVTKQDKETAEQVVSSVVPDEDVNDLFAGKELSRKKKKKKRVRASDDHQFSIGDDVAIKTTNEETGKDEFVSATVYKPKAPGNTIGVRIEGKPKMVDRKEVYLLKEMVLGMVGVPNIERMQQLAGIQPQTQEGGVSITPVQEPEQEPASGAAAIAMQALDALEQALPNVRLADLKVIRQRLNDTLVCLNEGIAQPGRQKKL